VAAGPGPGGSGTAVVFRMPYRGAGAPGDRSGRR
jgi:hypothetical protein